MIRVGPSPTTTAHAAGASGVGFTLDSMGGISNAALKFTNLLYAKGSGARRRRWDSDSMRIALNSWIPSLLFYVTIVFLTSSSLVFPIED